MKNQNNEKQIARQALDEAQMGAVDLLTKTQEAFADLVRERERCKMSAYRVNAVAHELDDLCRLMEVPAELVEA